MIYYAIIILALFAGGYEGMDDESKKIYKESKGKCNINSGSWNDWSVWNMCSESCGGGIKTRHRTCEIQRSTVKVFIEVDMEEQLCNNHTCPMFPAAYSTNEYAMCFFLPPINGTWGQWSQSTCRAGGINVQSRLCNNPSPKDCGRLCGKDNLRLRYCPAGTVINIASIADKFFRSDIILDFNKAKAYCSSMGGNLASIRSATENENIRKHLKYTYTWIGIIENKLKYYWTHDGSAKYSDAATYQNWHDLHGINSGNVAIMQKHDGKWHCQTTMAVFPFLCRLSGT